MKSRIPTNMIASLETVGKPALAMIGFSLIALVGLLDYLTGYEASFSLFYLLPISLVVWFAGSRLGVTASVVSAIVELIADVLSGDNSLQPVFYLWNAAIRFGFFITVTLLLARLKNDLEHEKYLSRTDYLTGATSTGFFYGLLQMQMDLFQRYEHPFTLAYLDLDNFKTINDRFGHSTGDTVLRSVVTYTRNGLRKTDIVARLGGDELAILLPETDQKTAQKVVAKIREGLLDEMRRCGWPVTFSIGLMTFTAMPASTNELIKMVDDLMYTVKHNGKNAISYSVYAG
jgi:diguanylate cyclase (GGDEF)-like protein